MIRKITALALVLWGATVWAQVPTSDLAHPPADAQAFTILSTSGTNGKAALWTASDGSHISRESILLRGQVWELDQSAKLGSDAMPSTLVVRGVTPEGDAAETFTVAGRVATWKSPVDVGNSVYTTPAFYVPQGGTLAGSTQLLMETLLRAPSHSVALLPGGRAAAERLTELVVGSGSAKKTVTAWAITGLSPSPFAVWTTSQGQFFGIVSGLAVLPAGYESDLVRLDKAQDDALAARSPALSRRFSKHPRGRLPLPMFGPLSTARTLRQTRRSWSTRG